VVTQPFIDVTTSGPLFDRRAGRVMGAYIDRVERKIAEGGVKILRREMRRVFKNPNGYYESRVRADRGVITDSGVVYGPWLAGTGSRNYPVTRFKGYDHWTVTQRELDRRKRGVAERVLRQYIGRF
jgi:hypothetical protein